MCFLRMFTYICSIRVNEWVYVFWALHPYTYSRSKKRSTGNQPLFWNTPFVIFIPFFKSSDECLCLTQPPMTGCCWLKHYHKGTYSLTATNLRMCKHLAAVFPEGGIFQATCFAMAQSATLQLHGKWCYTRQCFVQLVSLRCSYMKAGVTLGNVLCNLSRNVSICYVAVTWKVVLH